MTGGLAQTGIEKGRFLCLCGVGEGQSFQNLIAHCDIPSCCLSVRLLPTSLRCSSPFGPGPRACGNNNSPTQSVPFLFSSCFPHFSTVIAVTTVTRTKKVLRPSLLGLRPMPADRSPIPLHHRSPTYQIRRADKNDKLAFAPAVNAKNGRRRLVVQLAARPAERSGTSKGRRKGKKKVRGGPLESPSEKPRLKQQQL